MSIVMSMDSLAAVSIQRIVYPSILDCTVNDTLDTMGVSDNRSNVNLSLSNLTVEPNSSLEYKVVAIST